jgi:hypothetical protein
MRKISRVPRTYLAAHMAATGAFLRAGGKERGTEVTVTKICPRDPAKLDKYPDGYPGDADPPRPRPERTWKPQFEQFSASPWNQVSQTWHT